MIDNDMTNILKNFANADEGTGEIVSATGERKVSSAATEKNAMKTLLEGLDSQQKSVNQMPGSHTMAKNTATKHPADKFLVGGEFDEETDLDESRLYTDADQPYVEIAQQMVDAYNMNLDIKDKVDNSPEFFRALFHTSGVIPNSDMVDGSEQYERIIDILDRWAVSGVAPKSQAGDEQSSNILEVEDTYEDTIAKRKPVSNVHEKQSLSDIFRSMDETEEDDAARFKKELHDEIQAKQLTKGNNDKFNLAEYRPDPTDGEDGADLYQALLTLMQTTAGDIPAEELGKLIVKYNKYNLTEEDNIISSSNNSPIDQHVEALGAELYHEAVELAKEVFASDGPGKSGARNEADYVAYTVKRFLDKEYLRAIMGNIIEAYNNETKGLE